MWSVEKTGPVAATVRIPYKPNRDWEQWVFLAADRHIDNPKSDHDIQHYHLKQAVERNAIILDIGDMFDAMQSKQDRRHVKKDLLPELKTNTYLNDLVDFGYEFWKPYKDNLALMGEGNHETAITKHYEYSLIDGLVRDLQRDGAPTVRGGYRGWVRFQFEKDNGGGGRQSFNLYYHHGSGGGGPVTKGVIQTNRRAAYLANADIVATGHIHERWYMPLERVVLNNKNMEVRTTQHHIQLPTYKEEFLNEPGGFHHEKGGPPKPMGAWWGRFYVSPRTGKIEVSFHLADT